jgi:hypothetical protein
MICVSKVSEQPAVPSTAVCGAPRIIKIATGQLFVPNLTAFVSGGFIAGKYTASGL